MNGKLSCAVLLIITNVSWYKIAFDAIHKLFGAFKIYDKHSRENKAFNIALLVFHDSRYYCIIDFNDIWTVNFVNVM